MATESDLTIPTQEAFDALIQARRAPLIDTKDALDWEGLVLTDPDLNIDDDVPFLPDELRRYTVDLTNYIRAVAEWAEERLNAKYMREKEAKAVEAQIEEIDSELHMYDGLRSDVRRTLGMIEELKVMGEDVTYLYAALSEVMHRLSYASEDEGDGQELSIEQYPEPGTKSSREIQDEISILFPDGSTYTMRAVKAAKLIQIFLSQESWSIEDIIALRERLGFKESTFTYYVSTVRKILEPLGWTLSPSFAKSGGSVVKYAKLSPGASNSIGLSVERPHVEQLSLDGPVDQDAEGPCLRI